MSDERNERLLRGPQGERGDQGPRGMRGMTPSARRAVVYLSIVTLLLAAANLLFTSHQVATQAHDWCSALDLLTAHPVSRPAHPAANPSRVQAYRYYVVFLDLHRKFGC